MSTQDQLQEYIDGLTIVDTHEHLPDEENRPAENDVLAEWLTHYFSCDLVSAGLKPEDLERVRDSSGDLLERWDIVAPYWHAARSTGYGRSLDIAARGIYGIDGVGRDTIGDLDKAFRAAREKGGHYQRVLKDLSRIAVSIRDSGEPSPANGAFFVSTMRLDHFICDNSTLMQAARGVGVELHDIHDAKEAMERTLDRAFMSGKTVAIKSGLAYSRTLRYEKRTEADAEAELIQFLDNTKSTGWHAPAFLGRAWQDHMMHYMLKLADARGLPVQFHTGIQEGNGNRIVNSNPVHLTNLFLEYPNIKFDIFHIGYPYMAELSCLAKNFRNVFIDMCWAHIISPEASRRALVEWLDAVPANKISAFGGDYCFVDGVYGHAEMARRNVAMALAVKVEDGTFDLDRAKEIAHWLFIDNPARIFGLEGRV
jgi:uncharacterized protein